MKVYLVTLTGGGDFDRKLVDEESYRFILNGGEPPVSVIYDFIAANPVDDFTNTVTDEAIARRILFVDPDKTSTPENDRALMVAPSRFHGKTCGREPFLSTRQIFQFITENGLDLQDEEFEGGIY